MIIKNERVVSVTPSNNGQDNNRRVVHCSWIVVTSIIGFQDNADGHCGNGETISIHIEKNTAVRRNKKSEYHLWEISSIEYRVIEFTFSVSSLVCSHNLINSNGYYIQFLVFHWVEGKERIKSVIR